MLDRRKSTSRCVCVCVCVCVSVPPIVPSGHNKLLMPVPLKRQLIQLPSCWINTNVFFSFNLQVSASLAASTTEVGNVVLLSLWRTFWNHFLLWRIKWVLWLWLCSAQSPGDLSRVLSVAWLPWCWVWGWLVTPGTLCGLRAEQPDKDGGWPQSWVSHLLLSWWLQSLNIHMMLLAPLRQSLLQWWDLHLSLWWFPFLPSFSFPSSPSGAVRGLWLMLTVGRDFEKMFISSPQQGDHPWGIVHDVTEWVHAKYTQGRGAVIPVASLAWVYWVIGVGQGLHTSVLCDFMHPSLSLLKLTFLTHSVRVTWLLWTRCMVVGWSYGIRSVKADAGSFLQNLRGDCCKEWKPVQMSACLDRIAWCAKVFQKLWFTGLPRWR